MLDRLDFFTDESCQRSVDTRAPPSEWVPVLIHDDVCPDITLKARKDTVDPVAKNCSNSKGVRALAHMMTLSLNGLTSHVNLHWMDNWNLIQLSCLSAAKVLTKTEAIPQSETVDALQTE